MPGVGLQGGGILREYFPFLFLQVSAMPNPRVSLRGCRIVVAAADPRLVAYVSHVLTEADCRVFRAYDAQAVAELALGGTLQVDLVVTNSCVGEVEGDTLVAALRRHLPRLPVLHISAGTAQDREVAANVPADVPTLEEPFTDEQLLQAVRSLLH